MQPTHKKGKFPENRLRKRGKRLSREWLKRKDSEFRAEWVQLFLGEERDA